MALWKRFRILNGTYACREAALPHAQSGGDRRAANMRAPDSSFSDRRSQTDSFPQNDGFGAAEAMPEGQHLTTHVLLQDYMSAITAGICRVLRECM